MKNLRIKYKIVIALIFTIICFSIVNSAIYFKKEYKAGIENYRITGNSIVQYIEPHISEHLYLSDIVELRRAINDIKESNNDIKYIFILNLNKEVIIHTFNQPFPSDLAKINSAPVQNIELLEMGDESIYDFSYPVAKGRLGILRVGISDERLITKLRNDLINEGILLLIFITVGIIISLGLARLITNPIDKLVISAKEISRGNFNHNILIKSKDEVGILASSFNTMRNNLQELTNKLEEKISLLNKKNKAYIALNTEYEIQNKALIIAKDKAEESDKLKTAFLTNLSHEIRTPMNGILGFITLLKSDDLSQTKQKHYIKVIESSGQRLLKLITDLVNISKIEVGQEELDNKTINLNQLIQGIFSFYKPQAKKKGISFTCKKGLVNSKSHIITDSIKIEQILTNLLSNAFKFTKEGTIDFGYEIKENNLQFWVSDTGRGIPPDMKKLIFERFRQADNSPLKGEEGSGLGLAICKGYVELMGGHIWVESEHGKGSVFWFTVPYVQSAEKPENNMRIKKTHHYSKTNSVLIAEDDEMSFIYLSEIFNKYEMNIIRASNGQEAINYFRNNPDIKLILMDIKMPLKDGLEATKEIKKTSPEVPIIAQTAYASEQDRQKAFDAGCSDFIVKPINKEELLEKIDHILKG